MELEKIDACLKVLKQNGIKFARIDGEVLQVEFFADVPAAMSFEPKDLAKVLTDSMPPDSAMLFASSDDMALPGEEPKE